MYYCALYKVEVVEAQRPFHFSVSSETLRRESQCSLPCLGALLFCNTFCKLRTCTSDVWYLCGCWWTNDDGIVSKLSSSSYGRGGVRRDGFGLCRKEQISAGWNYLFPLWSPWNAALRREAVLKKTGSYLLYQDQSRGCRFVLSPQMIWWARL